MQDDNKGKTEDFEESEEYKAIVAAFEEHERIMKRNAAIRERIRPFVEAEDGELAKEVEE